MINGNQLRFEEHVIKECDLNNYMKTDNDKFQYTIDTLGNKCNTLAEIAENSGYNFCMNPRTQLLIYIDYKFKLLSKEQRKIAIMYFIENLSYREIAKIINKGKSTVNRHIDAIKKIFGEKLSHL